MGVYPNLGIIDGAFSAIVDGVQHCVRASRVMGADRLDTRVGPIAIEVVKPMRSLRIRVDHEVVKADLVFEARTTPLEEPRFTRRSGPRIVMDLTRFTQHGGYSGTLSARAPLRGGTVARVGARAIARGESGAWVSGSRRQLRAANLPQFCWLWSPTNFEDYCTHFDVMENADGSRWHEFGAAVRPNVDAEIETMASVDWKADYRAGTRHARSTEIVLRGASGEHRIELETLYNFYMQGIGYLHPKWGHGMYVGSDVSTYESFKLSEADERSPLFQHIQAVSRARLGKREGMGILEMLIIGPHERSGFREMLDMHG